MHSGRRHPLGGSPPIHIVRVAACLLLSLAPCTANANSSYDSKAALTYSYLASAAYCGPPRFTNAGLEAWQCGPFCDALPGMENITTVGDGDNDAYAFLGKLDNRCVVAFRGTSSLGGWITDLQSLTKDELKGCSFEGTPCYVGSGFLSNYKALESELKAKLASSYCPGSRVTVVGHSLGAAVATLAMFDLQRSGFVIEPSYTFGGPRVGDVAFVQAFLRAFAKPVLFRVTHHRDPIVHMPTTLRFHHSPSEIYYPGYASQGYSVCNGSGEDPACSGQFWDLPAMITNCLEDDFRHCDHMSYLFDERDIPMDSDPCTNRV